MQLSSSPSLITPSLITFSYLLSPSSVSFSRQDSIKWDLVGPTLGLMGAYLLVQVAISLRKSNTNKMKDADASLDMAETATGKSPTNLYGV